MSKHNDDGTKKTGTKVEVRNGDVTKALRRLKKIMQTEKILQEARDKEHFVKPSLKRARAKASAVKRWRKQLSKMDE
jgi:small subunit ribosomal protein S21